jgi:ribosomal protein S18 acetylase RimI-like enzyme
MKGFKFFFLTSLGASFLKAYYKACLQSDEAIAVCVTSGKDEIHGFAIGCSCSKGFHKRIVKQNLPSFLLQGLVLLLTKPRALIRLSSNLDKTTPNDDENSAELLSIVLAPEAKGKGAGKEMLRRFEEEAKRKSCQKVMLTTDYDGNDNVVNFYRKNGYSVLAEFTTYPNRKMYKMVKELKC